MVTSTQSTASRTITAQSGMILPATITPETDMNLMVTCISIYHVRNERRVDYGTLEMVMEAMRDASAVVTLYSDANGATAARCLWPMNLTLTADNNITARCYCTLRGEIKTLRLDRMLTCHALTPPDDMEAVEPHQDWEDSPQGRALAAR